MRQHKILTLALLILSIIDFALAAPAAVRWRPGVASQKRWDSDDEGELPPLSAPELGHPPPPSPDLTEVMLEIAHTYGLPPTPGSPESLPGSDLTHTDRPPLTPDSSGSLPGSDYVLPPVDHLPPPSPGLEEMLSQISYDGLSPTPDSPGSQPGSDHVLPPNPGSTDMRPQIAPPPGSMPVAGSPSPPPPPSPPDDRFPPGFEFLKYIRPRMSGSVAVNLAQRDSRSRIFYLTISTI
jgi:hypothetical protein